ncbi:hypothetical protein CEUSTIGMA_g9381.t1 [Chlamydomonas eustigma]|uniref:RING-type domain-containing protein n=1 Tax=Chlamydomonas eustigma TaxID=1157962 RepID=A0A250XFX3_9CHLO|nr:hypothetical protein CEUSTIGMA_g9381.t1 [Chlamydomonas eustigma]|eukprot:GAX81953.1 hypothetical protein CEUSTIGMA_g9381.t1 [Chlamydomonas eustigma]
MGITYSREKKEIKGFLLQAIVNGDLCAVKEIMTNHPQFIKSKLELRGNAFHMAVISRHDDVLAYLLSGEYLKGEGRNVNSLRILHNRALNNLGTRDLITPLMLACDLGDEIAVKALLDNGANFWCRDMQHNRTCLHYAAAKGRTSLIPIIIQHSQTWDERNSSFHSTSIWPLVDTATWHGLTPLIYATWNDHSETVGSLLEHKAGVDRRFTSSGYYNDECCKDVTDGSSALHVAAFKGSHSAAAAILSDFLQKRTAYRAQVQQIRAAQERGEVPPTSSLPRPKDPRLFMDAANRTPMVVAQSRDQPAAFIMLLNPFTPLISTLTSQDRPIGVPTLKHISSKVAQKLLLRQIDMIATSVAEQKVSNAKVSASKREQGTWSSNSRLKRETSSKKQQQQQHGGPNGLGLSIHDVVRTSVMAPIMERVSLETGCNDKDEPCKTAEMPSTVKASQTPLLQPVHEEEGTTSNSPTGQLTVCANLDTSVGTLCSPRFKTQTTDILRAPSAVSFPTLRSVVSWRSARNTPLPSLDALTMDQATASSVIPRARESMATVGSGHDQDDPDTSAPDLHRQGSAVLMSQLPRQLSRLPSVKAELRSMKKEEDRDAKIEAAEAAVHALTESLLNCKVSEEVLIQRLQLEQPGKQGGDRTGGSTSDAAATTALPAGVKSVTQLDQHLLQAVALITDGWEDQHLEQTLIAARYHRLMHGVGSSVSEQHVLAAERFDVRTPEVAGMSDAQSIALVDEEQLHSKTSALCLDYSLFAAKADASFSASSLAGSRRMSRILSIASTEGPGDEYDNTCGICLDDGDFIFVHPCNHKICIECARELLKVHPTDPAPCPFCRSILLGFGLQKK